MIDSLTVCVEYDDFLEITLPANKRHFQTTLIITSPEDKATQSLAEKYGCNCLITDAFYRDGAKFNKGLAMEEGFDFLDSKDWIYVWDSDIVMPQSIEIPNAQKDCLYVPIRHILNNPKDYRDNLNWKELPSPTLPHEFDGYSQLFHSSIPIPRPWYGIDWIHAAGCDSDFEHKFPPEKRMRAPFEVLHLGSEGPINRIGKNWMGRTTPRIDNLVNSKQAKKRIKDLQAMIRYRNKYGTAREKLT